MQSARSPGKPHQPHVGSGVAVGPYEVLATGTQYEVNPAFGHLFDAPDTVLVPLTPQFPGAFGNHYQMLWAPLKDFGGVPADWEWFLTGTVVPMLQGGQTLLAYCVGSHGRTGTFLASLIALLETEAETPDPIAAVRERHCEKAVETLEQAKAIFALRGQAVPTEYLKQFAKDSGSFGRTTLVAATQPKKGK